VRLLLTLVLFLPAVFAGTLLLLIPGYDALLGRNDEITVLAYVPVTALTLAGYLLAAWLLVRWVDRRRFADLGLRLDRTALLGLLVCLVASLVIALVVGVAANLLDLGRTVEDVSAGAAGISPLALLAVVLLQAFVLQGIGEEVLFRGYLLQTLRRRPIAAVLIAAVVFTIPHLLSSGGQQGLLERFLYLAIPFGFAISAGYLMIALRSTWAAIGIHGGFHVATFVVAQLGFTNDGPAVWLVLGALHALLGVVVALRIPRSRWDEVREHGPCSRRSA
jgi:membrane protease YdiL (CAAX protease family)